MSEILCPLAKAAKRYSDEPALITGNESVTYGDYNLLVSLAVDYFQKVGVSAGTRVAIVGENHEVYVCMLMALFRLKAVACPISARLPQKEISEYVKKVQCDMRFDLPKTLHTNRCRQKQEWDPEYDLVLTDLAQIPKSIVSVPSEQDATIIHTSGTTALPKAVLHSYANHYYSALGSNKNITFEPGDRWLLSLPLYHIGGLAILFRAILGGGAVVLPSEVMDILDAIERYHITHLSLVPTQLYRLLKSPSLSYNTKQLKAVLVGGSAIPQSLIKRAYGSGLPLFTTYGLTEMASQVTTTRPDDSLDRLLTSGKPLEHRQVKISNDGEILVRGDTLFRGYVDNDEVILPVDDDGWFHTGDLGSIDDAGYLTVTGRKDNMFISGGENIHPEQIEGALSVIDYVSDVMVVPVEDDEFGFRPVAFVRITGKNAFNKSDLVTRLEQYLPRFMIPIRFYKWPVSAMESDVKPARRYFCELVKTGELTELT